MTVTAGYRLRFCARASAHISNTQQIGAVPHADERAAKPPETSIDLVGGGGGDIPNVVNTISTSVQLLRIDYVEKSISDFSDST